MTAAQTTVRLPEPARAMIRHYLAQGWEWRIITRLVNRTFRTEYTAARLRGLFEDGERRA